MTHFTHKRRSWKSERGASLFNLLTTLMIVAIVGALGIPQLANLTKTFDRFNARANLLQDLKRSQAESITEGCRGIVNIAASGQSYTFGCDYLSYDPNADPQADDTRLTRVLPENVTVTASAPIIFDSRGQSVATDGIVQNVSLTLLIRSNSFATGTLLGTGVFSYD